MPELKKIYKTIMDDSFPDKIDISFGDQTLSYTKKTWKIPDENGNLVEKGLRYGENPGQEAAMYELSRGSLVLGNCHFIDPGNGMVSAISENDMLQSGKHPGKINLTDIDSGLNILKYLIQRPCSVIIKHNNPSGAAYGNNLAESLDKALMADRIAAFGGCCVFNRAVDMDTAHKLSKYYFEVIAAPEFEDGTLNILKKRKNLRIIRITGINNISRYRNLRFADFKSLMDGGFIVQQSSLNSIEKKEDFLPAEANYKGCEYKINRHPTDKEYEDLLFGWALEQGVTSNSVLYIKDCCTVGIGTGEQDRVGVAEIAIFKAYTKYADALSFQRHGLSYKQLLLEIKKGNQPDKLREDIDNETISVNGGLAGSVMISDAFFPFRDGVDVAIKEGITAIAQPGGSERDFESIIACNEVNPEVAMVYTGQRAFKH